MKKLVLCIIILYSLNSYSQEYTIPLAKQPVTFITFKDALGIDSILQRIVILEKRVDSLQSLIKFKRREKRPK